jgi:hypothetical protein
MSKVYSYEQFLKKQREKQAAAPGSLCISAMDYELWRNPSTVSTSKPLTMDMILDAVKHVEEMANDRFFAPVHPFCPFCYDPEWKCDCMRRMMYPQPRLVMDEERLDPEDYDAVHDAWERNDE